MFAYIININYYKKIYKKKDLHNLKRKEFVETSESSNRFPGPIKASAFDQIDGTSD